MDIDRLEPGRELDALVAEKVMGWRWRPFIAAHSNPIEWMKDIFPPTSPEFTWASKKDAPPLANLPFEKSYYFVMDLPHYSTDIAAAWEVAEKLGHDYSISVHAAWTLEGKRCGWTAVVGEGYAANAPTAPHAICLAALKAVASPD